MEICTFLDHDCVQSYLATDVSCTLDSPIRTIVLVHLDHLGLCLQLEKLLLTQFHELS